MVCKVQLAVLLAMVAVCQGLTYQNPVLEGVGQHKAIKYNNLYYMVGNEDVGNLGSWFPIYLSADGEKWARLSYAFTTDTVPAWTSSIYLEEPFLHYEGGYFYLFFRGYDYQTVQYKIGVAKSLSITGPFTAEPRPLPIESNGNGYFYNPAVIKDNNNGDTYLIWSEGDLKTIRGQMIYLGDLTFSGLRSQVILEATLSWEQTVVKTPSAFYRSGWYYIFYGAGISCTSFNAIGVARSRFPIGQYEKKSTPLISQWPSAPSVLQGLGGSPDVLLYQGRCSVPSSVNASTLVWGADAWPQVPSS